MMDNRKLGNAGEDLACRYLERNGYEILERNKHFSRYCEIDIIAKYKNKIVFVEVKTRKTNSFGVPAEAISRKKLEHLRQGALFYLKESKIKNYQIDVIGITLKPEIKIEHLKNISC